MYVFILYFVCIFIYIYKNTGVKLIDIVELFTVRSSA